MISMKVYAWHLIPLQTISMIYYAQLSYYKMSDNDAIKRTGDEVLEFARCYAEAAAEKELSS
ncbi:TPA: hypothetical protein ACV740_005041 [Escherichia coli]